MEIEFLRDWRRLKKAEIHELPRPVANVLIRRGIAAAASTGADTDGAGKRDGIGAGDAGGGKGTAVNRIKRHRTQRKAK